MTPEQLAEAFHRYYEAEAPRWGYKTRDDSAVPWAEVPEANRSLMLVTATRVLLELFPERLGVPFEMADLEPHPVTQEQLDARLVGLAAVAYGMLREGYGPGEQLEAVIDLDELAAALDRLSSAAS